MKKLLVKGLVVVFILSFALSAIWPVSIAQAQEPTPTPAPVTATAAPTLEELPVFTDTPVPTLVQPIEETPIPSETLAPSAEPTVTEEPTDITPVPTEATVEPTLPATITPEPTVPATSTPEPTIVVTPEPTAAPTLAKTATATKPVIGKPVIVPEVVAPIILRVWFTDGDGTANDTFTIPALPWGCQYTLDNGGIVSQITSLETNQVTAVNFADPAQPSTVTLTISSKPEQNCSHVSLNPSVAGNPQRFSRTFSAAVPLYCPYLGSSTAPFYGDPVQARTTPEDLLVPTGTADPAAYCAALPNPFASATLKAYYAACGTRLVVESANWGWNRYILITFADNSTTIVPANKSVAVDVPAGTASDLNPATVRVLRSNNASDLLQPNTDPVSVFYTAEGACLGNQVNTLEASCGLVSFSASNYPTDGPSKVEVHFMPSTSADPVILTYEFTGSITKQNIALPNNLDGSSATGVVEAYFIPFNGTLTTLTRELVSSCSALPIAESLAPVQGNLSNACQMKWQATTLSDMRLPDYTQNGFVQSVNDATGLFKIQHQIDPNTGMLDFYIPIGTAYQINQATLSLGLDLGWDIIKYEILPAGSYQQLTGDTRFLNNYTPPANTVMDPYALKLGTFPADSSLVLHVMGVAAPGVDPANTTFTLEADLSGTYLREGGAAGCHVPPLQNGDFSQNCAVHWRGEAFMDAFGTADAPNKFYTYKVKPGLLGTNSQGLIAVHHWSSGNKLYWRIPLGTALAITNGVMKLSTTGNWTVDMGSMMTDPVNFPWFAETSLYPNPSGAQPEMVNPSTIYIGSMPANSNTMVTFTGTPIGGVIEPGVLYGLTTDFTARWVPGQGLPDCTGAIPPAPVVTPEVCRVNLAGQSIFPIEANDLTVRDKWDETGKIYPGRPEPQRGEINADGWGAYPNRYFRLYAAVDVAATDVVITFKAVQGFKFVAPPSGFEIFTGMNSGAMGMLYQNGYTEVASGFTGPTVSADGTEITLIVANMPAKSAIAFVTLTAADDTMYDYVINSTLSGDEVGCNPNGTTQTPTPPVSVTETPVPTTETPVPTTETPVPTTETPVPTTETPAPTEEPPFSVGETPVPTKPNHVTPAPTQATATQPVSTATQVPTKTATFTIPYTGSTVHHYGVAAIIMFALAFLAGLVLLLKLRRSE